jgi:hypothetical protein
MERDVVVLVELPTEGDRLDELLYVGLTRATTELVVIAPPGAGGAAGVTAWGARRDRGRRQGNLDARPGDRHTFYVITT